MLKALRTNQTQHYLDWIDGLRGWAIFLVLFNHWYQFFIQNKGKQTWLSSKSGNWISVTDFSVILFFLVSSFTIFRTATLRFPKEQRPYLYFFIRRFFRIIPMWWITMLAYVLYHGDRLVQHLCCFFLYFPFFDGPHGGHYHPGGWTLFAEETFYLGFIPIFRYVDSAKKASFFFLGCYLCRWGWLEWRYTIPELSENIKTELFPLTHWYVFAAGILLYYFYKTPTFKKIFQEGDRWTMRLLTLSTGFAILRFIRSPEWGASEDLSMVAILFLFIAAMCKENNLGKLARLSIFRLFGISCYSIYLFHHLLILALAPFLNPWLQSLGISALPVELQMLLTFPLFAALNLVVGVFSYCFLELVFIQTGKKIICFIEERDLRGRKGRQLTMPSRQELKTH